MIYRIASLAGLLLVALLPGCDAESPSGLPTTRMKLGNSTVTLEIANSPVGRARGLMHRSSMPDNHGMIFIFPDEQMQSFWMKNTRIPLDIVFINRQSTIVSIHTMEPYTTRSTSSAAPAQFAIELNAGKASRLGLSAGQTVALPPDLPQARDTD